MEIVQTYKSRSDQNSRFKSEVKQHIHYLLTFAAFTQNRLIKNEGRLYRFKSEIKSAEKLKEKSGNQQSAQTVSGVSCQSILNNDCNLIWKSFVNDSLDFNSKLRKAYYHLENLTDLLEKNNIKLSAEYSETNSLEINKPIHHKAVLVFAKYGINVNSIRMAKTPDLTLNNFKEIGKKLRNVIKEDLLRDGKDLKDRLNKVEEVHQIEVEIQKLTVAEIIAIVGAVVSAVQWIVELIINSSRDNNARDIINGSTCEELQALSDADIDNLISDLLDGITGDRDENAIISLLRCLGAERVRENIWPRWGDQILDNFHGDEMDSLRALLAGFGIMNFEDMDDDATRAFINSSNCATLNNLLLHDIRELILNLFAGWTTDRDENAIIRLIECLPCDRVRALLEMSGTRYSDFDYNFQGDEWRELRRIFERCGV